jgi:hypothetical protein
MNRVAWPGFLLHEPIIPGAISASGSHSMQRMTCRRTVFALAFGLGVIGLTLPGGANAADTAPVPAVVPMTPLHQGANAPIPSGDAIEKDVPSTIKGYSDTPASPGGSVTALPGISPSTGTVPAPVPSDESKIK